MQGAAESLEEMMLCSQGAVLAPFQPRSRAAVTRLLGRLNRWQTAQIHTYSAYLQVRDRREINLIWEPVSLHILLLTVE